MSILTELRATQRAPQQDTTMTMLTLANINIIIIIK